MRKRILGLDLGISSIGWALIEINDEEFINKETGEVFAKDGKIIDSGVRIFDAAEVKKTKAPAAEARRLARSNRRRLFRKARRCAKIRELCIQNNLITDDLLNFIFNPKKHELKGYKDVWILRKEALERKLSNEELTRVLCHIVKHRGWKSTRKSEEQDGKNESGKMKGAIEKLEKTLKENCETAGFYYGKIKSESENFDNEKIINEHGCYDHSIGRSLNLDEITKIFTKQREFGFNLSKEFEKEVYDLCDKQKEIQSMKEMVGDCPFEPKELRAPKESYSAELFNVYTKINNLKVLNNEDPEYNKNFDSLIKLFKDKKEVKYSDVRKLLKLNDDYKFKGLNYYEADYIEQKFSKKDNKLEELSKAANEKIEKYKKEGFEAKKSEKSNRTYFINKEGKYKYKNPESSVIYKMEGYHKVKDVLSNDKFKIIENDLFIIDSIMEALAFEKSDDKSREYMQSHNIPEEIIDDCLNISTSKFIHISSKAIKNLLPHLRKGLTYDKACEACHYEFKDDKKLQQKKYLPTIEEYEEKSGQTALKNAVVKRTITQTRKLINAVIRKYDSFDQINIEFTRELGKSAKERSDIEKGQKSFEELKKKLKEELKEFGYSENQITDKLVLKYRLYKEQDGKSIYSLDEIDLRRMLDDDKYCEIDHILPYSKSFDDSMANKVVVLAKENQNKKNRTPYEYLNNITDWEEYKNFIWNMPGLSYRKKKNLTIENPDFTKWKARNLCDTSYISKYLIKYLNKTLKFKENDRIKNKIQVRPGALTSYLRHLWGLGKKDRSNDKHHMVDAIIIACATQSMCQLISCLHATKNRESIEEQQKEIIKQIEELKKEPGSNKDKVEELEENKKWYNLIEGKIDLQAKCNGIWDGFINEVDNKIDELTRLNEYGLPVSKIVSRMARRKITGKAHDDTIVSIGEDGIKYKTIRIEELKPENLEKLKDKDTSSNNLYNLLEDILNKFIKKGKNKEDILDNEEQLEEFSDKNEEKEKTGFKEKEYQKYIEEHPIYMCNNKNEVKYRIDKENIVYKNLNEIKLKGEEDKILSPKVKTVKIKDGNVKDDSGENNGVGLKNNGIAKNGGMPRVDIFYKDGKYYAVPFYIADFVKKEMPIVAKPHNIKFPIQINKKNSEDKFYNEFFKFSLFPDELIFIEHENGEKFLGYYIQYSAQTGQIYIETTDRSPTFIVAKNGDNLKKINLNVIKNIKKFQVDQLGYISKKECIEKRQGIIKDYNKNNL